MVKLLRRNYLIKLEYLSNLLDGGIMSSNVYFLSENKDMMVGINGYLASMGIFDTGCFTFNDISVISMNKDIYMEVGKKINSYVIDNYDINDLSIIIDKKKMKIKKRNN